MTPDPTLVVALVADRRIAVPAAAVEEVLAAVAIVPLPGAPAIVEGVVDLRGTIVAVCGLYDLLGIARPPVRPSDVLVVVRAGGRPLLLRVDRMIGLSAVRAGDVARAEALVCGRTRLAGVVTLPDGLALILDLAALLSQAEADALDGALERR